MGTQQSSTRDSESQAETSRSSRGAKTCYYDLLEVDRLASDEEIRKAYRRKALLLHPDRNFGDSEACTQLFTEVQSAYDVLSDPQERSWYDSHRDAFLQGFGDSSEEYREQGIDVTTIDDILNVLATLNKTSDYSDSPSGYYNIVGSFFNKLLNEEIEASQLLGREPPALPAFGNSLSQFESSVRNFYSLWSSFATAKSFSWKDVHRISEAQDRHVRRLMEKENKKCRIEHIKEFNENIRALVLFIKKRDPRVKLSTATDDYRQKMLRDASIAQAARSRAQNMTNLADYVEPEWSNSHKTIDEDAGSSDDEKDLELFECIACRKVFKSENQFQAHERSKKHLKAVRSLRQAMQTENETLDLK